MTVRPTSSGQTPRPGIDRTGKAAAPGVPNRPADTPSGAAAGVRGDDVQISAQARELQQQDAASRGAAIEMPAERLKEVLTRLEGGYYDQPRVKDAVLRRLTKDL